MDIVTCINLPINGFCRIEHVKAEITTRQHLQCARLCALCSLCVLCGKSLMGIVECLAIVFLGPGNVCLAGESLTHHVLHLLFLSDSVCAVGEIGSFVIRALCYESQLCGVCACIVK